MHVNIKYQTDSERFNMNDTNLTNITCFDAHKNLQKKCNKSKCRYWHDLNEYNNCIINNSNDSTHTLQEIGDILNITRMRVCQIEKNIFSKLKKSIPN